MQMIHAKIRRPKWMTFLGETVLAMLILISVLPIGPWSKEIADFFGWTSLFSFLVISSVVWVVPSLFLVLLAGEIAKKVRDRPPRPPSHL